MSALLETLDRGTRINDAIKATYGFELDNLDDVWTARQFGLAEPALIPVSAGEAPSGSQEPDPSVEPEDQPEGRVTPSPFVQLFKSESAAGEVFEDSKWRSFGNWPVIATGLGAISGLLFFALRSLKNRGSNRRRTTGA